MEYSFFYGVTFIIFFVVAVIPMIVLWTYELDKKKDDRSDLGVDMWLQSQFTMAFMLSIFAFIFTWWLGAKSRVFSLYIDCQTLTYEIYRGDELRYRGHFHNIYVKLKCVTTRRDRRTRDKTDPELYYLVLCGVRMAPVYLSPRSKSFHEMRRLGKRIATNFNLNFVDMECVSKHHHVRHRCPYDAGVGQDDGLESIFDVTDDLTEETSLLGRRTLVGADSVKRTRSVARSVGKAKSRRFSKLRKSETAIVAG